MNEVVNPMLVRRGVAGAGRSEVGTLEHVGRKSGTVRLTPVHPVLTADGVRIVVPLGLQSEWARNVLAAGRCRLQLHDTIYELDRPVLLPAGAIFDIPGLSRWAGDFLGFMYLQLRRVSEAPGTLAPAVAEAGSEVGAEPAVAEVAS